MLFNDPNIVKATINRVNQAHLDTIYWQQYLTFRRTTTRLFKDYIGKITGVMAGSINSRFGEKNIRERKEMGQGYGEVAYLGDAYQMSVDRLSEIQDLIDKFNEAKSDDQKLVLNEILSFIQDDYRQVLLAAHKRMDIVVGQLLMTGKASVKNKDNRTDANTPDVLEMSLPFKFVTPENSDVVVDSKLKFITYLQKTLNALAPDYGKFSKMLISRASFVKYIVGSSEFGDNFKNILGSNEMYLNSGLITSPLASQVFVGLGMPAIEIKEDYVKDQNGKNVQVYADDHIQLLNSDQCGYMRFHTPYEMGDPVPGRNYTPADGDMVISNYRDKEGRYMEYAAEWIPQISDPDMMVNFDLTKIAL